MTKVSKIHHKHWAWTDKQIWQEKQRRKFHELNQLTQKEVNKVEFKDSRRFYKFQKDGQLQPLKAECKLQLKDSQRFYNFQNTDSYTFLPLNANDSENEK